MFIKYSISGIILINMVHVSNKYDFYERIVYNTDKLTLMIFDEHLLLYMILEFEIN